MSHWLDETARELSEGRFSRRQVLQRCGASVGGALLASLTAPLAALAAGTTCPDGHHCGSGTTCCGPDCCDSHETCCGGKCHPVEHGICCDIFRACDPRTQQCCEGRCVTKHRECCRPVRSLATTNLEELCEPGQHCCREEFEGACYDPKDKVCCTQRRSTNREAVDKDRCCKGETLDPDEECCGSGANAHPVPKGKCKHGKCKRPGFPASYTACGATCCGGNTPTCCTSPTGAACCGAGQQCCGGHTVQCVTPYPKGDFHFSNYDGKPNENVFCCPDGDGGTCGNNQGESHPACQGGGFGCVCTSGVFCPTGGCCDIFGSCKNPC